MEDSFPTNQGWGGDGLGIIQAHYIYCALCFYCDYTHSTSVHRAFDPGVLVLSPRLNTEVMEGHT